MEARSVVATTRLIDLDSLLNSGLGRYRKGMFLFSLHLLKLFKQGQCEKHLILDFNHREYFDIYLNGSEIKRLTPKNVKYSYQHKLLVALMGSFLISARVDCLTKKFIRFYSRLASSKTEGK